MAPAFLSTSTTRRAYLLGLLHDRRRTYLLHDRRRTSLFEGDAQDGIFPATNHFGEKSRSELMFTSGKNPFLSKGLMDER